ncbi:ATP synthase subunit a [Candidatus Hepatincolaceae symbiont of Richtersius coronifer]
MLGISPIDQFKVQTIGGNIYIAGVNISFTNSALFMVLAAVLVILFFYLSLKNINVVPSKLQMVSELSYDFVAHIAKENIGDKAKVFFPFIFSIFMFILFGNLLGTIPYSFAFTSQIIITFSIALLMLTVATIYGIIKHKSKFFKVFIPSGLPFYLIPFMAVLEFISYFAKALSMGIRLFANIMAGHIIIEIFAGFIIALGIFGIIPLSFTIILYAFELMIACIQAYIFTILTCLFLEQVINLH